MLCPKCNAQNSDAARYCNGCGMPISQGCSVCGASLRPGARFCEDCGTPAGTPAPAAGVVDKRSDPVAPLPRTESLTTQPPPFYLGTHPQAVAAIPAPWQWAVAIAGGAVFLYNTSFVIFIACLWLTAPSGFLGCQISSQEGSCSALGRCAMLGAWLIPHRWKSLATSVRAWKLPDWTCWLCSAPWTG